MRSGDNKGSGRLSVRLAAAGLAVLALTAACGTAAAPGSRPARLTEHHGGPPWNDRAGALVVARNLLSRVVLPAGSHRLPQRPLPPGLHQPGSSMAARSYLDSYRLYRLPHGPAAAAEYLRTHPPAGLTVQGTGTSSTSGRITERSVTFAPKREPFGISAADLVETVVAGPHGGALMRADAEVIWFPRRSAAEHLNPADYRSVRVVAHVYGPRRPRTIARTFTSRGAIGRLIRLLNSLPASPGEAFSCPISFVTVRVAIVPVPGRPAAVATSGGCGADTIAVGGRQQPALSDFGGLQKLAERLLHIDARHLVPAVGS